MAGRIPETGEAFLRDFLYVDAPRVRSLLAQLANGYPTQTQTSVAKQAQGSASLKVVAGVKSETTTEVSSRSLEDLAFAAFEEAAEEVGFLRDITDIASKAKLWKRGALARAISPGQIFRVTAPTSILDPSALKTTLSKWNQFDLNHMGGSKDDEFEGMLQLVEVMYGNAVIMRVFPAGIDESSCHFVGTLDEPEKSFDRETLLGRLGVEPAEWTVVAQVTRSPRETSTAPRRALDFTTMTRSDRIDRWKLEELFRQTIGDLEKGGMAESPIYPAIAVMPLAIYRVVEAFTATDLVLEDDD
jgi:hypothetical protein